MKPWKYVILAFSIFLMFFSKNLPTVMDLPAAGMAAVGIFVGTITLMLTISTMWPPFLCMVAVAASGIFSYSDVLKNSLGSWPVCYIICATMLCSALRKSGFLDRMAIWIVTRPIGKKHPWLFIGLMMAAPLCIGVFMDVMATTVVFMTVYASILDMMGYKKGDYFSTTIMMGVLFFSGMSQCLSPISHVNIILGTSYLAADYNYTVNTVLYIGIALVTAIVIWCLFMLYMRFIVRLDISRIQTLDASSLHSELGPMSIQEKTVLSVFGCVIALWFLPNIFPTVPFLAFIKSLGTVTPPILGLCALCIIHIDGKPAMNFLDTFIHGTSWGAIPLTAVTMLLSAMLTKEDVGFVTALTNEFGPFVSTLPSILIVICAILFCVIMTNFASNTVSYNLVYACTMPLIYSGVVTGVSAPALVMALAFGSGIAIATPAASSYSGMVAGSGWIKADYQFQKGVIYSFMAIISLICVFFPLASALF